MKEKKKTPKTLLDYLYSNKFKPWTDKEAKQYLKASDEFRHGPKPKTFTFKFIQRPPDSKINTRPEFVKEITEKYCCKNMESSISCYRFEPKICGKTIELEMHDDCLMDVKYCMYCGTKFRYRIRKVGDTMADLIKQKARIDPKKIKML